MRRGVVDTIVATATVAAIVGIGAFLVWHVDESPSPKERAACGAARVVRADLQAHVAFVQLQHDVRRMAHDAGTSEDATLSKAAIDARSELHRYHSAFLRGAGRLIDREPMPIAGTTDPKAQRTWRRVERAVARTEAECGRLGLHT